MDSHAPDTCSVELFQHANTNFIGQGEFFRPG